MKVVKENFVDIPLCLFKYNYGISVDDALDLCHERGKILSPVIGRKVSVSTGANGFTLTKSPDEFYLLFISDMVIKNDTMASFKEEIVEIKWGVMFDVFRRNDKTKN